MAIDGAPALRGSRSQTRAVPCRNRAPPEPELPCRGAGRRPCMHARWSVRARLPRTCGGNGGGAVVSDRKRRGGRACLESSTDEDPEKNSRQSRWGRRGERSIPEIIRGNRKQSVETQSPYQSQSEQMLRAYQSLSEPVRAHQSPSEPIRAHQSRCVPMRT